MKAFIIFAALFVLVAAKEHSAEYEEKFRLCKEETGVSDEIAKRVKVKDFEFDDKVGKCFAKCLCESKGFCIEGKLDTVKLEIKKPEFSKEKLAAARDLCNKVSGDDECDTTFKRLQCFFKELPELKKKHEPATETAA